LRTVLTRVLITLACRRPNPSANPAVHLASPPNQVRGGIIARQATLENVGCSHRLRSKKGRIGGPICQTCVGRPPSPRRRTRPPPSSIIEASHRGIATAIMPSPQRGRAAGSTPAAQPQPEGRAGPRGPRRG
jgi:hypothetical protein